MNVTKSMKGVILAGGLGTRLLPMTRVTNKHLLPVYDRPVIYYPIQQLVQAGITDIIIVTGGNYAGDFLRLLGNGHEFGLKHLNYTYQNGEGGVAEALGLAEHFAGDSPCVVILGDNLFQRSIRPAVDLFREDPNGAVVLLKEVTNPAEFGVARFEGDTLVEIVEKPSHPPSNFAVTGCYVYDQRVFDIVRGLNRSARGELEITDVNNHYLSEGSLRYHRVDGWWVDAGTVPTLSEAGRLVAVEEGNPVLRGASLSPSADSPRSGS